MSRRDKIEKIKQLQMQQFQNQKQISKISHNHAASQMVLPSPDGSDQVVRKLIYNLGVNTPYNKQNELTRRKNVSNSISVLEKYQQRSQTQFQKL